MEEVRYFIYKYKKSFIILVTILILIIIALSIIRLITELNQRQGKLAVPINIVPSSAEIQIDNQPIKVRYLSRQVIIKLRYPIQVLLHTKIHLVHTNGIHLVNILVYLLSLTTQKNGIVKIHDYIKN